jgi:phosphonate transport system permease protein
MIVTDPAASGPRTAFAPNWLARLGWIALAVYVVYAGSQLGFSAARFSTGLEHGHRFLARMFPPNFGRWELI